jgi:hypothetical protein
MHGWGKGKRFHWQSQVDFLQRTLADPHENLVEEERYEMTFRLAEQALGVAEENARRACHLERLGNDAAALETEWIQLERNLEIAQHAAESVLMMGPPEPRFDWVPGHALCRQTLAASRLGDVERARVGASMLIESRPCSIRALVEFGHALHERGLYVEARRAFDQAARLESEFTERSGDVDVACPSATPKDALARFGGPQPDQDKRWCSWADYLEYREIGSALALGELDQAAASSALSQLAAELRERDRECVETIVLAIEHDIEQLAEVQ